MITLDQVRALEERVGKAVATIERLKSENTSLYGEITKQESRISELEALIDTFKKDQARIEEGIVNALERLNSFEDLVTGVASEPAKVVAQPQVKPKVASVPPQNAAKPAATVVQVPEPETDSAKTNADELGIF
jgi:chromosome segregation ATPase